MMIVGIIAILAVFVGAPAIVFSFLHKDQKNKREKEIEKLKLQKEILELERANKLLENDNKTLDKLINESAKSKD